MENIIDVAQYVFDKYKEMYGNTIEETKLHKILYFAQRESFAIVNEPLFSGDLEGWKYGPVSPVVRTSYSAGAFDMNLCDEISLESMYIVNNVLCEYGNLSSGDLSSLSHKEISWQNARRGLEADAVGNKPLILSDIQEDAKKVRPYDHIWDMYYDEFKDWEG